jgi:hypothetical protein
MAGSRLVAANFDDLSLVVQNRSSSNQKSVCVLPGNLEVRGRDRDKALTWPHHLGGRGAASGSNLHPGMTRR